MAFSILVQIVFVFSMCLGAFLAITKIEPKREKHMQQLWNCEYGLHGYGRLEALLYNLNEVTADKQKKHPEHRSLIETVSMQIKTRLISQFKTESFQCGENPTPLPLVEIYKRGLQDEKHLVAKYSYRFVAKE